MTRFISGGPRAGLVRAPASKSAAHRWMICAALSENGSELRCGPLSADLAATADCLAALGASVRISEGRVCIGPLCGLPSGERLLPCGESGSTLRFLLPVAGALGERAVFERRGRLPLRPLAALAEELRRHGMTITEDGALLHCKGRLRGGDWTLPGSISSQFISALLMVLPLLEEDSRLTITGDVASAPYIALTEQILRASSIRFSHKGAVYAIPGGQRHSPPASLAVEGDWSSAAPFLAMGALSEKGVYVEGLDLATAQGERAITELLRAVGADVTEKKGRVFVKKGRLHGLRFDASQTPDLVPVVAALGALCEGETRIENAARLRDKESNRLYTTAAMLSALGAEIRELPDGLVVCGRPSLSGGESDAFHRNGGRRRRLRL